MGFFTYFSLIRKHGYFYVESLKSVPRNIPSEIPNFITGQLYLVSFLNYCYGICMYVISKIFQVPN